MTALGICIGAVALYIVNPLISFPWQIVIHDVAMVGSISTPLWVLLIWLSVVSTVFIYLTGINAQCYLSPVAVSQLATLEVNFAALLLSEILSLVQVIGAIIMLSGILLALFMVSHTLSTILKTYGQ